MSIMKFRRTGKPPSAAVQTPSHQSDKYLRSATDPFQILRVQSGFFINRPPFTSLILSPDEKCLPPHR